MSPDDPRHGTNAGYICHTRSGVASCAPCRAARVHYEKRRINDALNHGGRLIDPTGARRRIQALVALGWTFPRIGAELGVTGGTVQRTAAGYQATVRRDVAERIADVYERMSMTVPPKGTRQEKKDASYARTVARRHGWFPPLAWDDIDDPDAVPNTGAVVRIGPGRPEVITAKIEDFDFLRSVGETEENAAARVGIGRLDSFRDQRRRALKEAS